MTCTYHSSREDPFICRGPPPRFWASFSPPPACLHLAGCLPNGGPLCRQRGAHDFPRGQKPAGCLYMGGLATPFLGGPPGSLKKGAAVGKKPFILGGLWGTGPPKSPAALGRKGAPLLSQKGNPGVQLSQRAPLWGAPPFYGGKPRPGPLAAPPGFSPQRPSLFVFPPHTSPRVFAPFLGGFFFLIRVWPGPLGKTPIPPRGLGGGKGFFFPRRGRFFPPRFFLGEKGNQKKLSHHLFYFFI